MKTCECGGKWYRHGTSDGDQRYRCKVCRKCITVRDGEVVVPYSTKMIRDWRYEMDARTKGEQL